MPSRSTLLRRLVVGSASLVALFAVLVVGIYALVVFVLGEAPGWRATTEVCRQPDTVKYEDGSYAVYVWEPSLTLSLSTKSSNAVVSHTGAGTYGVAIELNPSTDPRRVTCRWETDRVEIVEPNGIVHTVPTSVFTGGR